MQMAESKEAWLEIIHFAFMLCGRNQQISYLISNLVSQKKCDNKELQTVPQQVSLGKKITASCLGTVDCANR